MLATIGNSSTITVVSQQYHIAAVSSITSAFLMFSFVRCGKVVAKGHVWECTTVEGELPDDATATSETTGYEARMKGSLSLLVELDQVWRYPLSIEPLSVFFPSALFLMNHHAALCCAVLYCTTVLYCTVLYCTALYCIALHCTVPWNDVVFFLPHVW